MMDEFHLHSMFDSLSILYHCPENTRIPAPKIRTIQVGPKIQSIIAVEIELQLFVEIISANKLACVISSGI
jgi:hypothetical protein